MYMNKRNNESADKSTIDARNILQALDLGQNNGG